MVMSSQDNAAVSPCVQSAAPRLLISPSACLPGTSSNDTELSVTPGKGVSPSHACHPHSGWRGLPSLPGRPTGGLGSVNTFASITAGHAHALTFYFSIAATLYVGHMPLDNLFLTAFSKSHLRQPGPCSLLIYASEGPGKRACATMLGAQLLQK